MPNGPPAGCCVKVLIGADNANVALCACLLLGVHHLLNAAHLHLLLVQAARAHTEWGRQEAHLAPAGLHCSGLVAN